MDLIKKHQVEGTAGRNFRENKKHLIENEDYFSIKGNTLRDFKQATNFVGSNAKEIISDGSQRFIEGEDYFIIKKSLKYEIPTLEIPNRGITLITESGYFRETATNWYVGLK